MRLSGMRQRVLLRSFAALSDACKHYPYTLDVRDIRFDTRERYHLAPPLLTSSSYAIRARASGSSQRTRELRKVERRWKFCRSFHSIFPIRSFHRPRHSLGLPGDRARVANRTLLHRERALLYQRRALRFRMPIRRAEILAGRTIRARGIAVSIANFHIEFAIASRAAFAFRNPRHEISQSISHLLISLSLSLSLSLFFFLFFLQS